MSFLGAAPDVRVTGRRIVATIVDGLVFGAITTIPWLGIDDGVSGFDLTQLSNRGGFTLLGIVLVYYVVLEAFTGRTVGKLVCGIKVVDAVSGGRPGLLAAISRTFLRMVDGFLGYLVAFLIVVNNDNRRRLGDMVAKTLVVRA